VTIVSHTDLPEWVWELVASLSRYEDEHPILYTMTDADVYERTPCPDGLTGLIPREVREVAELLASRGSVKVTSMFSESGA
jgi:hypothetical protein